MTTVKAFRFPVSVEWRGGRLTEASVAGKPSIAVATPPEFKGTHPATWSPEDLLVSAVASCYAVTLVAVAERRGVPLHGLTVAGTGHVERRPDGRFGFVAIELLASIETEGQSLALAEQTARDAKELCLVGISLDTPVHLELELTAAEAAA